MGIPGRNRPSGLRIGNGAKSASRHRLIRFDRTGWATFTDMASRAQRRHHRERVIANRMALAMVFHRDPSQYSFAFTDKRKNYVAGMYADRQAYLGCPDGRKCPTCHPFKRKPTRQEMSAVPDLDEGD